MLPAAQIAGSGQPFELVNEAVPMTDHGQMSGATLEALMPRVVHLLVPAEGKIQRDQFVERPHLRIVGEDGASELWGLSVAIGTCSTRAMTRLGPTVRRVCWEPPAGLRCVPDLCPHCSNRTFLATCLDTPAVAVLASPNNFESEFSADES